MLTSSDRLPSRIATYGLSIGLALCIALPLSARSLSAQPLTFKETPTLERTHEGVALPPVAERLPQEAAIVDMEAKGRVTGRHGGDLHTIIGRSKDARLINVWGYARLVGFNDRLELVPDILRDVTVEDGRIFTLHIRKGHKWSDGHPFTAEDFRYFYEDIAENRDLRPSGEPEYLLVDGVKPEFRVIDEYTVQYEWHLPNPSFLPTLAKARPPFIYRPAHYLKQFHGTYGDEAFIAAQMEATKKRNWAGLHNKMDDMYNGRNYDLPTLQPWVITKPASKQRQVMVRNPFFHRADSSGQQLPYIDRVIMDVADARLISAKTAAGEADLQARGLGFSDITILKTNEKDQGYETLFWPDAKGARIALLPNLTIRDPVWRELFRDRRFRFALSHGVDRRLINRVLFFGLAKEANNTVLEASPLHKDHYSINGTEYDPQLANQLLDEIGLTARRGDKIRLLPDGRPLQIIVETEGESVEIVDVLELVKETWREIGVDLYIKPSQRDIVRRRAYAGLGQMVARSGFDNGIPTPEMEPEEFTPVRQDSLQWSAWGEHHETASASGEEIDFPPAARLKDLHTAWSFSRSDEERARLWHEILEIHAAEMFTIGLVSEVRQPVIRGPKVKNVPDSVIYGWDPGAHFGIHRMDEFFIDDPQITTGLSE